MFAYEIPSTRFSLPAGGNVKQHRFVSVNSNSDGVTANASTQVVGVSMNEVVAGKVLEVADGLVMVEAAEGITAGTAVYSDAEGKAASSGTIVAGVAITSASADGELITVKM